MIKLCASVSSVRNSSSFLQSYMWGEFKSRFGWNAHYFTMEAEDKSCTLLVLSRRLMPGFSFAYIPWGPEIECSAQELCELAKELKQFLLNNTVFIRFDLPWENEQLAISNEQLKKAVVNVQAPDTVIIDLSKSCEDILANMKPKWRYNISLAGKKGVKTETCGIEKLPVFYNLMKETAARDGIFIHSFEYYKVLFEMCEKDSECEIRLYTASHEDNILASIFVLLRGDWATYLYGASSNIKRNLMAPYALQWQAMQDAKDGGCKYYDLFGIPPCEDPNHPMAGLYRFKTGFGGSIVHRPGCWDFAYKKITYSLYRFAETFRKKTRKIRIDLKMKK